MSVQFSLTHFFLKQLSTILSKIVLVVKYIKV